MCFIVLSKCRRRNNRCLHLKICIRFEVKTSELDPNMHEMLHTQGYSDKRCKTDEIQFLSTGFSLCLGEYIFLLPRASAAHSKRKPQVTVMTQEGVTSVMSRYVYPDVTPDVIYPCLQPCSLSVHSMFTKIRIFWFPFLTRSSLSFFSR